MAAGDLAWIGTTVAAVTGLITTAYTAARGRAHTEYLAWVQRHQDRIADAYTAVLEVAERASQWAAVELLPLKGPDGRTPEPPPYDMQGRANALLRAYGSPEIRDRFEQWLNAWNALAGQLRAIRTAEQDRAQGLPTGPEVWEIYPQLHEQRLPALRQRYDELAAAVNEELGRRPAFPPWWKVWRGPGS